MSDFATFQERSRKNSENRALHHHVFNTWLAVELVNLSQVQILAVETAPPYHIAIVAAKLPERRAPRNEGFRRSDALHRHSMLFPSDTLGPGCLTK